MQLFRRNRLKWGEGGGAARGLTEEAVSYLEGRKREISDRGVSCDDQVSLGGCAEHEKQWNGIALQDKESFSATLGKASHLSPFWQSVQRS